MKINKRMQNSFNYDLVINMNYSHKMAEKYNSVRKQFQNHSKLATIFNHRCFNLLEKNFIKNFLDLNNLDHLMFSVRPSSKSLILEKLRMHLDMLELIFVIQIMSRYEIPLAIMDNNLIQSDTIKIDSLKSSIISFLNNFKNENQEIDINKQFPWITSVNDKLENASNYHILSIKGFPEDLDFDIELYYEKQINELEKHYFWLGFDSSYKEVPHDKKYKPTNWEEKVKDIPYGLGIFHDDLKYCSRCCLPETMEGIELDEFGVCVPCRSSEDKMHINWEDRRKQLDAIFSKYRDNEYYDCLLPISGGKDSTYQSYVLSKVLEVTPLSVTACQNWQSIEGRYNLENCLQQFDLDHLFFNKSRHIVNKAAKKSLQAIGDVCWHCHINTGVIPIQTAVAWNLSLMCYGESIAESDGRDSYSERFNKLTETSLYYNLEVSAKVSAEEMVDDSITEKDISPWIYPPRDLLKECNVYYIHLGDYFFWDEQRQVEYIKRNYEWLETKVENTYKGFKSVECVMAGVHDYANFIKRGIGRATVHASEDVRRGLITREEGFELVKKYDIQRPHALDYYLKITGLTEEEFEKTVKECRKNSIYANKLDHIELEKK